jgi:hypothetical protein
MAIHAPDATVLGQASNARLVADGERLYVLRLPISRSFRVLDALLWLGVFFGMAGLPLIGASRPLGPWEIAQVALLPVCIGILASLWYVLRTRDYGPSSALEVVALFDFEARELIGGEGHVLASLDDVRIARESSNLNRFYYPVHARYPGGTVELVDPKVMLGGVGAIVRELRGRGIPAAEIRMSRNALDP